MVKWLVLAYAAATRKLIKNQIIPKFHLFMDLFSHYSPVILIKQGGHETEVGLRPCLCNKPKAKPAHASGL